MSRKKHDGEGFSLNDLDILFVHNTIMWYRVPFFKLLSENLNITFVFTDPMVSSYAHGGSYEKELERLQAANAVICQKAPGSLSRYFSGGSFLNLFRCLFSCQYDILVDIVQFPAVISLFAARIRKKPLILWLGFWSLPNTRFFKLKMAVARYMVQRAQALVVYGSKHKEAAIRWGVDPERIFIMPNVSLIETDLSHPVKISEMRRKYTTLENALASGIFDRKIVLYVGKLIMRKGVDYLIKAFALLKREIDDVALLIIGDGPEKNNLVQLSTSLLPPNSVFFLGRIEQSDLPFFFSRADVCVVPSVTLDDAEWGIHTEPWGLVMNEAMQFGRPMVATDAVGAAFDLIRNGTNGFLVREKDEIALFEGLKAILGDDELRLRMGQESKKLIETHFQYKDMLRSFCSALEFVCRNKL